MFINFTLWSILRVLILLAPAALLIDLTVLAWVKAWHPLIKGLLTTIAALALFFLGGHSIASVLLMPHTIILVREDQGEISVERLAVLFDQPFLFQGTAYPALARDLIANDTTKWVVYEELWYQQENANPMAFSIFDHTEPDVYLIPPKAVYEAPPAYGHRIKLDYTGYGKQAPPEKIQRQVPGDPDSIITTITYGSTRRYWLHWIDAPTY